MHLDLDMSGSVDSGIGATDMSGSPDTGHARLVLVPCGFPDAATTVITATTIAADIGAENELPVDVRPVRRVPAQESGFY